MPLKTNTFKLGADPELNINFGEHNIQPSQLLSELFPNSENKIKGIGEVGTDGGALEIRMKPSENPQDITKRIAKLLKLVTDKIPLINLSTLSSRGPIGGHIHLEKHIGKKEITENKLATILNTFYLPIAMSENKNSYLNRILSGYGQISSSRDITRNSVGGKTIEYRLPSAEWLTTPKITTATFAYMATIYHEILNYPEKFNKKPLTAILLKNNEQAQALQKFAMDDFANIIESILKTIKRSIRTFELYPKYKQHIEYILNPKKVKNDKIKVDYNATKGWKLNTNIPLVTKRNFLNNALVNQKYTENNQLAFDELIQYSHGNEHNMELFINELKKRTIAYNWIPKNKYHFFGMRNGINDVIIFQLIKNNELTSININGVRNLIKNKKIYDAFIQYTQTTLQNLILKYNISEKTYIIGIPYKQRVDNNTKPFIEAIYNTEKNQYTKDDPIDIKQLPNTTNKEQEKLIHILTQEKTKEDAPNNSIINEQGTEKLKEFLKKERTQPCAE